MEDTRSVLALAGSLAWIGSEAFLGTRVRARGGPAGIRRTEDRGSGVVVVAGMLLGVFGGWACYWTRVAPPLPFLVTGLGLVVLPAGLALRAWSVFSLGPHFSYVVRTSADQSLVRAGPYRWLRHPSYTGNLMIAFGLVLLLPTGVGLLVVGVSTVGGHLWRIRVEEQALRTRFPDEFPEYASTTWRLIPGVY